ncbi:MAG: protein kinase domain-containing protein [Phycisphaerae bacterium]
MVIWLESHLEDCQACRDRLKIIKDPHREVQPILGIELEEAQTPDATTVPQSQCGPMIEGYVIESEIDRGGQGVVYRARQDRTNRIVAIKVLLDQKTANRKWRQRFIREIELAAQLDHPSIVSILHSGFTKDDQLFYVMDFINGKAIDEHVRTTGYNLRQTLALFSRVCTAVQFAHLNGVIHRDLKPQNILVDEAGHPRVLDFGLAKSLDVSNDHRITTGLEIMGTICYMSPEQAQGSTAMIDARTDVYSLGIMLYELLTEKFPYPVDGGVLETIRHIVETPAKSMRSQDVEKGMTLSPVQSSNARSEIRPDYQIDQVVLRAIEKERQDRYQSAGDLGRDIERYLSHQPIEANRDRLSYFVIGFFRRRARQLVATVVAIFLVLGVWLLSHDLDQRKRAEREANLAQLDEFFRLGQHDAARDLLEQIWSAEYGDIGRARAAIQRLRERGSDSTLESAEYYELAMATQDHHEAIHYLDQLLAKDPSDFRGLLARSARYDRLGLLALLDSRKELGATRRTLEEKSNQFFVESRVDAERARSVRPESTYAWANLGAVFARMEQWEEGIPILQHAIKLDRSNDRAWTNLGNCQLNSKQVAEREAIASYENALELNSSSAGAWRGLGKCYKRMRDFERAKGAFQESIRIEDDHADTLFELGQSAALAGDESLAIISFESLLKVSPDYISGLNYSAWLLLTAADTSLRQYDLALERARRAASHANESVTVLGTLALAEFRSENYLEARAVAARAIDLGANSFDVLVIMASACTKLEPAHGCHHWRDKARLFWQSLEDPDAGEVVLKNEILDGL